MQITQKYLTTEESAKYCGYSKILFERMRREGKGPAYIKRSRKDIRYCVDDLDSWMAKDRIQTNDSITAA